MVMTRHNIPQVGAFKAMADHYGAQLRLTRFRPSGRGADSWDEHPTDQQQQAVPLAHGPSRRADRRFLLPPLGPR